jgi:hypothetical protein
MYGVTTTKTQDGYIMYIANAYNVKRWRVMAKIEALKFTDKLNKASGETGAWMYKCEKGRIPRNCDFFVVRINLTHVWKMTFDFLAEHGEQPINNIARRLGKTPDFIQKVVQGNSRIFNYDETTKKATLKKEWKNG